MMGRDIVFSLMLHLTLILATVVSSPFEVRKAPELGEVIRVSLTSMPAPVRPAPEPVAVPKPAAEEQPEIALDDPTTAEPAEIEPEPEPEPEKEQKQQVRPEDLMTDAESQESGGGQDETSTRAGGAGFGDVTIDNASFNYPYWFDLAFHKLRANFRNPVPYEGTLVCAVYFQVIRSGRVIEVQVADPSGVPAFDRACLQAVEDAAPFPPLPKQFRDEIIGITVPFKSR